MKLPGVCHYCGKIGAQLGLSLTATRKKAYWCLSCTRFVPLGTLLSQRGITQADLTKEIKRATRLTTTVGR